MGFVTRYLNIWEMPRCLSVREAELTKATQGSVQARPPVLGVDGSGFLSIAVMNTLTKSSLGRKGLVWLNISRSEPITEGSQGRNLGKN